MNSKFIFWEFHGSTSPILTIICSFEFVIRNKAKNIGWKEALATITFAFTLKNVLQGALMFM